MRTHTDPRVVLVAGATGDLGRAVAGAFAAQGARLALTGRDEATLVRLAQDLSLPPEHLLYPADLAQLHAVHGLCQAVLERFGQIDVLVSAAGGFQMGRVHETSVETLETLLDMNLRSAFNLAHGVVPSMITRAKGRVIFVAARAALQGAAGIGAYAASKAALLRLSESMALDLSRHGVTVNCVLPSVIDTERNRRDMPEADPGGWVTPESIAGVILFLASDAARDISGAAIPVYGRA